eukprot:TRINITY_DN98204_c0_g1_i1.p1 TRINITY_DN98204_c0_g1~~TRINITY_DN98204_c0_g1_i1.p1  ORF type:complete len:191 (-),score=19.20 TRINITY_DN98204_c0_g1_i1:152-724(-)
MRKLLEFVLVLSAAGLESTVHDFGVIHPVSGHALKLAALRFERNETRSAEVEAPISADPNTSFTTNSRVSIKDTSQRHYTDASPFGRESEAQALTEAAINESNKMVDQIERAEVAETKRAVFRSLTRLRGAAISSFDGIANAQQQNIEEYANRSSYLDDHPVKHLAAEESDVSQWAFPSNADLVQVSERK